MANVFSMSNERVRDVNRNTFDLSFKYSGTFKFGALYPVFLKEILPGDSWKIDPTFGFEFMPMVFPVQTQMKAHLHFFYVRSRNLWDDKKAFFGALKENLDPPYVDYSANFNNYAKTGSLGDYLGLPTTTSGSLLKSVELDGVVFHGSVLNALGTHTTPVTIGVNGFSQAFDYVSSKGIVFGSQYDALITDKPVMSVLSVSTSGGLSGAGIAYDVYKDGLVLNFTLSYDGQQTSWNFTDDSFIFQFRFKKVGSWFKLLTFALNDYGSSDYPAGVEIYHTVTDGTIRYEVRLNSTFLREFDEENIAFSLDCLLPTHVGGTWCNPNNCDTIVQNETVSLFTLTPSFYTASNEVVDIDETNCPFYGSKFDEPDSRLKISAEPFRAYESVYNCFYRDARNNPLVIDGQPEYNEWIPTKAGGLDQTLYRLRYRNWEPDFLTTAVQSPQQGVAPLVGITTHGDMRFMDQETGSVFTAKANLSQDGKTIESFTVMTPTIPEGNLLALVDMVSTGISINDFRNVNALQVWLETNMRKGMTFKDLIKGHFNVDVRFDELDMPEFIGGVSRNIEIHSVTQTSSDVNGSPLGSYAGQASCVGASGDSITHFCDEPGYIIGILSIVPVPAYSQLLPKHFIKRNTLDYYSPEFGHVGFVPIKYDEVCPVQAFSIDPSRLYDTFGYQRAWYDYLASTDEIHGLFRTNLKSYLMTRTFDLPPQLSESFLLVDPGQLNDVFASTTENDDKILGQIYYDVSVKRPIPRFGVPRLE